jgi:hypothetical protein
LPDDAIITSVALRIRAAGLVGTDPFTTHGALVADVRKGGFSGSPVLQTHDFQALAHKPAALVIKNVLGGGWYSGTMPPPNFVYINKAGITQFRLRFTKDDDDNYRNDYLRIYGGDSPIASSRPTLIVKYYLP